MRKSVFGLAAFLTVMLAAAPAAPAMQQQSFDHYDYDDGLIGNLCALGFDENFDYVAMPMELDYEKLQKVRIELLQRGFNPGLDFERDAATDAQLREAVALFQWEQKLPVTGQIDAATLTALYIPVFELSPKASPDVIQRAKPSK
jgi:peptidoglycan hydrolase-like protein with peptidoglycan-binding domain